MNRFLILLAGLALAGAAAAASPPPAESGKSWHWWLHPKLGMVKVDRASHAMVVSGRQRATAPATNR